VVPDKKGSAVLQMKEAVEKPPDEHNFKIQNNYWINLLKSVILEAGNLRQQKGV
jgi:hypothetical protein